MTEADIPTPERLGEMIISDVLERWPATAEVFHANAMACVGCAVAPFFTIADAAAVYSLDLSLFLQQLLSSITHV